MKKKVRVIASGVFDLIHYGHIRFLEKAKEAGGKYGELFVVVARDATVRKFKGMNPILPEEERRAIVASLKPVDKALLGHAKINIPAIIEEYKPDLIAVGHDQSHIEKTVKDYLDTKDYDIKVVRIGRFGREDVDSSTKLKQKIARLNRSSISI